jgi:hypothetical protein
MSTGEVPVVKSKLPIRLTLRHATGEMPLRISMAFWSLAASLCSYTVKFQQRYQKSHRIFRNLLFLRMFGNSAVPEIGARFVDVG